MNEQIEAIRNEIERRKKKYLFDDQPMTIGRYYEDRDLLSFIDSLPEEPAPKGYDEAYLNECIAKASKTWEGVDVDKYMDEVRGNRPLSSDNLEDAAEEHVKSKYCLEKLLGAEIKEAVNDFKAGAQWQEEQGYTKETTVYDNRWTDVYEVTVSLGRGEYGFKAMDKVIVQIRKA